THVVLSQHRLNNQCHQSARPRDPRPVGSKKPSDLVALRWVGLRLVGSAHWTHRACSQPRQERQGQDRKSTRLNSSHVAISYGVLGSLLSLPTRRSSDLLT